MKRRKYHYIIPIIVTAMMALTTVLVYLKIDGLTLFERIDFPLHDRLFRVRNFIADQPISPDIALVGIDDYTYKKIGQYGKGIWLTRKPFLEQLKYFRAVYKPSVLAYDIIFREFEGEEENKSEDIDTDKIDLMMTQIQAFSRNEISEVDNDILTDIARFTSRQANMNLASALASSFQEKQKEAKTIIAYDYTLPEEALEKAGHKWSQAAILGTDPDDLSEDNGTEIPYLRDVSIPIEHVHNLSSDYKFSRYAALPTKILLDYSQLGYINVPREEGGIVRRLPLVLGMEYDFVHPQSQELITRRFFLPSMSLLCCLNYWGIDLPDLHRQGDLTIKGLPIIEIFMGSKIVVRKPNGEVREIPIDDKGYLFLDFVGKIGDFNGVHFADVGPFKAYEEAKSLIQDKIAIVGVTATGSTDVGPCPVDDYTPFVHIHMVAISNILTNTFIQPLKDRQKLGILALVWLIFIPATYFFRPVKLTYYAMMITAVYFFLVFYYNLTHQFLLPITAPGFFFMGSYLFVVLFYYFTEEREKRHIRGMFSTMVSGDVLKYLEDNPGSFSLAGQRAEATMFFSDVAGFTSISESLTPDKLVELLNAYLSPMTEIIMNRQGYIDKYEGDAIMADWGVPYPNPDHAKLACWAALEQQQALVSLRPLLKEKFNVDIHVRMGLNSGVVSAGNMGSDKHMSFTVMGDAVNQAARFEPANKDYNTLIMIGETTFQLAKDHIEARLLDRLVVKGKTIPIQIYELIAKKDEISDEKRIVIDMYDQGLKLMWERKWEEAIKCFEKALAIYPDDGPSRLMIERVNEYVIEPPPAAWQGEYVRTKKD